MVSLLIGQFGVYALAWLVGALLVREVRRPLAWWSAYCALQALGLWLLAAQPAGVAGATALTASVLLLAYTCADVGIDLFVHGRVRRRAVWLGLLGAGVAAQAACSLADAGFALRAASYNLGVAALLIAPLLGLREPLRREFGLWGLLPLLPGGLICLLALVRSASLLLQPPTVAPPPVAENPALLMATLLAAGAFNISFIGMVMGRLLQRLHQRVDTDGLTDLANRGGLEKHLAMAWESARRQGTPLSVAFIDIDRFKAINDSAGHEAGDRVIREVATQLRQHARLSDLVGRWGGDEFMVVMPHTDEAAAAQAVARLQTCVEAAGLVVPAGCEPLSLSIGLATRSEADHQVQDLVARADAGMYRAKRQGGVPAWPSPEAA